MQMHKSDCAIIRFAARCPPQVPVLPTKIFEFVEILSIALVVVASGIPSFSNLGTSIFAVSLFTRPPIRKIGRCAFFIHFLYI